MASRRRWRIPWTSEGQEPVPVPLPVPLPAGGTRTRRFRARARERTSQSRQPVPVPVPVPLPVAGTRTRRFRARLRNAHITKPDALLRPPARAPARGWNEDEEVPREDQRAHIATSRGRELHSLHAPETSLPTQPELPGDASGRRSAVRRTAEAAAALGWAAEAAAALGRAAEAAAALTALGRTAEAAAATLFAAAAAAALLLLLLLLLQLVHARTVTLATLHSLDLHSRCRLLSNLIVRRWYSRRTRRTPAITAS